MFAIIGTIPEKNFPLVTGEARLDGQYVRIQGNRFPVNRGTPALLAASIQTCEVLGAPPPFAFLAGDIGLGDGSRALYAYLETHLSRFDFETLTFHYLQPDADWHNRVLFAIQAMPRTPLLIADAGFMYAAKMSGQSQAYDLFTPDVGELAFLADEEAPHPFYTRGFILHEEQRVPELIRRARAHGNTARHLLVKGEKDYVVCGDTITNTIDSPVVEALEAMGGTGDTLTGIVTALLQNEPDIGKAAAMAARVNRLAGFHARPTPATQVMEIIRQIPTALKTLAT